MKITLVQSRGLVNDPKVNFFKARMRINNIDSEVFVFPEMFCTGYVSQRQDMQLQVLENAILKDLAKLSDNKGSTIICGCPVAEGDDIYDSALIIDGFDRYSYRKMFLYKDNVFDETKVFKSGGTPMIVDRQGLKMGMMIGHDLFIGDLVAYYAENGADMIICISALLPEQIDGFLKVAQSSAIRFSIPILVCNMTGNDCGKELGGKSAYISEKGEFLETCTAGSDVREIRIDVNALKANTASRSMPPKIEFSGSDSVTVKKVDPDPNGPFCPFSG